MLRCNRHIFSSTDYELIDYSIIDYSTIDYSIIDYSIIDYIFELFLCCKFLLDMQIYCHHRRALVQHE